VVIFLVSIKIQPFHFEILLEYSFMAHPSHTPNSTQPTDVVESIVHDMPIVLPLAGAVLMFLLAFIAVFMA
jgi:hypothetical protein